MLPCTPGNARTDSNSDADRPELHDELIHSDVPLYGYEDDLIPQHFSDDDGSFGCMSRVAMGDWTIRRHDAEDDAFPVRSFKGEGFAATQDKKDDRQRGIRNANIRIQAIER